MEFRSPHETPVRLALTSGHSAIVGPEWRNLPEVFHYEAMSKGCQRRESAAEPDAAPVDPPVIKPGDNAMNQTADHDTAYRKALETMLTREVASDFTRDSLPNVNAVSKLCGFSARKEDVLRVFRAMKDEAGAGG